MDKKSVLFGFLASILLVGSLGVVPISNSFAEDDNLSVSKEDSESYKKQLEKAEKEKEKAKEREEKAKQKAEEREEKAKQKAEEREEKAKQKAEERKEKLEEKQKEQKEKLEDKKQKLEEKRKEQQLKAEEKRKKLQEKKAKLDSDRKKLEEKLSKKINKYEDKLREIKEKYQNRIESESSGDVKQFSAATAKLEEKITKLEDKAAKKSEEIREKLEKKLAKLDTRTQKILDKINDGDYLGKKHSSSTAIDTYELVFDSVEATAINDKTQTSSLTGFMSFTTFDKGKSNLKLELDECQITVDSVPYNCGFGKARTASSGDSGAKDSLVILAFLEDDVLEEVHSTLKIFLNADSAIRDIEGSSQVSILGPQSKIAGMWFLEGEGTLTKTVSDSTDDSTDGTDDSTDDSAGNNISVELTEEIGISEN